MAEKASEVSARAGLNSEPRASGAAWVAHRERGSARLLAGMILISLRIGRPAGRLVLYCIALYYFLFAPTERRHQIAYLRQVFGRKPTPAERFRQLFAFSTTLHDRLYVLHERYDLFDISTEGEELMLETLARGRGAFLLGAHLGSTDMIGAVGRRRPEGLRVALAMYEDNASRFNAMLRASGCARLPEIIPLGHIDAMLRIRDCLAEGTCVGLLADRTIGEGPAQLVNFLGRPALFPTSPMRAAAALRCPVIFMCSLYQGGNRYRVIFREIADFAHLTPERRDTAVREGIARYVALLEQYCREGPYNWFNFYDFWQGRHIADDAARESRG